LLHKIEELFTEYLSSEGVTLTEGEIDKINKLFKSIYDLISLIIELYDEDKGYNKLNFDKIIQYSVGLILHPGHFNEEVILSACSMIPELLSVTIVAVDHNGLLQYIEFAKKVLSEGSGNVQVVATFACSLFYLYCYNNAESELIKPVIEKIYTSINFDLGKEIMIMNDYIQNFVNKIVKSTLTPRKTRMAIK
jgi:hypothetical protein